ncbi:MAG: glycoside hydrolase family 15 protein [Candidatus Parvarchaeum sp.]
MGKKKTYVLTLCIIAVVILVIVLVSIRSINNTNYNISTYNSSVSNLLLSNWKNDSVFIYTGINSSEVGLSGLPFISDIMVGKQSPSPDKLYFLGGETENVTLNLNNEIVLKRTNSTDLISTPFDSNLIIIEQNSTGTNKFLFTAENQKIYLFNNYTIAIENNPIIYIVSPGSVFNISSNGNYSNVLIEKSGNAAIYLSFSHPFNATNTTELLLSNDAYIKRWLNASNNITLKGSFLKEYYTSLLVLKDDQNPVTGEFAASPSPIYLYAWVRDGSFAAMSLQDAGHINSAEKYWNWMDSVQKVNGTWYTRYNFWTSAPDTSYGIPEYDSVGLFQLGVSSLYNITHNASTVKAFLPAINKSLNWEEMNINESKLIPQDLSIWEDVMAYNFWTQAMDLLGMKASITLLNSFNINTSKIAYYSSILNDSVSQFYNGSFYAEYATPTEIYINGKGQTALSLDMIADSSSILPIAFGLVPLNSVIAKNDVHNMIESLYIEGGLARFTGDTYHYTNSLHDSSGPMPPWVITTLFLGYYYEKDGNYTGAFDLMKWSIQHSQNFLLPEAIDPNYGNPLQTTSPLTWSAAMYVIDALNYK